MLVPTRKIRKGPKKYLLFLEQSSVLSAPADLCLKDNAGIQVLDQKNPPLSHSTMMIRQVDLEDRASRYFYGSRSFLSPVSIRSVPKVHDLQIQSV